MPQSKREQYQGPGTDTNAAIIKVINCTCAYTAMKGQNVCLKKRLYNTSRKRLHTVFGDYSSWIQLPGTEKLDTNEVRWVQTVNFSYLTPLTTFITISFIISSIVTACIGHSQSLSPLPETKFLCVSQAASQSTENVCVGECGCE